MRRVVITMFLIALLTVISVNFVYGDGISTTLPETATGSAVITSTAKNMWSTVTIIVQILALAAVVFAGIRYMLASSSGKADIKKGMIILVVGAVLVFSAATVLQFIKDSAEQIM